MISHSLPGRFPRKNPTRRLRAFLLGLFAAGMTALPLKAAEEIEFVYTPLVFSVSVASLETFAKEGKIDANLRRFLARATPEAREQFREALLTKIDIDPVLLSRFFNSVMGADMLSRLGKGITIEGGINGKYALRGAIVSAAFEPGGLTLLNVLKKFPNNIQLQGEEILGLAKTIDYAVYVAEIFIKDMRLWTAEEAAAVKPAINYASLPDLRQRGSFQVKKEVWNLTDSSRNRSLYVNVYIPQTFREGKTPVIIFSHGLASRPEDYAQAIEHLASYGFLVAAPQHPGSDTQYLQGMLGGYYRNIFDGNEFINRPKDISFVIDELARRNASQFQGKLNLTNVGVAGHSFGGYTSLAVAGAQIDFDNLAQDCNRPYSGINIAILLECRALELPRKVYNFRDERVTAVFAANPVNRSIFGEKGLSKISIPVLLGSGSYDPAANPIFEQAIPFTWLKTPDKYLAMVEGQAHVNFTELDAGMQKTLESVVDITLPDQNLIEDYAGALLVSFFEVYIADNEKFRPFLRSSYAEYLSQGQKFKLDFITAASDQKLSQLIEKLRARRQ
ncbi:MAG: alpha/beta hydrolase [Microcystis aeruginosa Ma_QC_C_20070703_M131]|uniref:Alpha/beta hydrolase n=1 Tax=Microcystis aeruginosa Ma_QC_C_20070703_M131 TaxID=2486263 RepID=A0A551X2L3_MICAE|nr:MAG: alpha/beta hydrolase [Microcystis aeruginosa Ma_QC_C_20070703_M131]